jgi:hypothetical protein
VARCRPRLLGGSGTAEAASGGDSEGESESGPPFQADQHEQPGVDVQESSLIKGGQRATGGRTEQT